jgi:hypothetical protein
MKKFSFLIVIMFLFHSGWSQTTNTSFKYAIKLYNLTSFEDKSRHELDIVSIQAHEITNTELQILHPTVAFQWKTKKNNLHEIELTNFSLDKVDAEKELKDSLENTYTTISGAEVVTAYISVRYEYILNLNKFNDAKFVPSVGFGINPYYRQINQMPKVTDLYTTSEMFLGARAFIIPRLTWYFSPKFFADIDIPICIFDLYFQSDEDQDPRLSVDKQTTNTVNFNAFPKFYSGRIGIGLKI